MESGSVQSAKEGTGPTYTLAQKYSVKYRIPSHIPIQLIIRGNKLRIRFFVRYNKNMMEIYPGTNLTYADIFESAVRENWGRQYAFPWLADDGYERAHAKANVRILDQNEDPDDDEISPLVPTVRTTAEFIRFGSTDAESLYPGQHYFNVRLSEGILYPAHVISPVWRWYWGFFRHYQLEAIHLNWSRNHPGNITLQKEKSRNSFKQVCAHETGHVLGLGDAYGANYRFFYEAPGTGKYMMCHNRKVQPEEMEMLFKAHITNEMQYFPRKFQFRTFAAGLRRTFRLQFSAAVNNSKNHS